jgi:hypothetical protein
LVFALDEARLFAHGPTVGASALGHGDVATTLKVYAHAIPRDDAGEADRLDKMLSGPQ